MKRRKRTSDSARVVACTHKEWSEPIFTSLHITCAIPPRITTPLWLPPFPKTCVYQPGLEGVVDIANMAFIVSTIYPPGIRRALR